MSALARSPPEPEHAGERCWRSAGDVELEGDRPRIRVEGTLQRVNGLLVVLPPKTERSKRIIPLPVSLAATLRRVRTDENERRCSPGLRGTAGSTCSIAETIDPDAFGRAFRTARAVAELEGVRLHDLRHAVATMLVNAGTNVRIVSDLLGHSTVALTLSVYVHRDEDAAAAAVAGVAEMIGGSS